MSDTTLDDIRDDIAARLQADQVLDGTPVVTERSADPLSEVAVALGMIAGSPGRKGVAVIVLPIEARPVSENIGNTPLDLRLVVRVVENPQLNDTGRTAMAVARRVVRVLHHYQPAGLASCLIADSPAIQPVADEIAPIAYDVQFAAQEEDGSVYYKVSSPTVWPDEGHPTESEPITVSIACDTPGAEIRYTTDGSPPYRSNGNSAVYTGPFRIDGPTLIRASAWLDGHIASDAASTRFD